MQRALLRQERTNQIRIERYRTGTPSGSRRYCYFCVHVHVHLPSRQDAQSPVPWRHIEEGGRAQTSITIFVFITATFQKTTMGRYAPSISLALSRCRSCFAICSSASNGTATWRGVPAKASLPLSPVCTLVSSRAFATVQVICRAHAEPFRVSLRPTAVRSSLALLARLSLIDEVL